MDAITILATVVGIVLSLGTLVTIIYLVFRFRHGIMRALGVATLVFLTLVAVAMLFTYTKQIICLIPLAIIVFIVWLFTRK